jgi:hypothetical protein
MRQRLFSLVLVLAACGGKQKHVDTVPLPPEPKQEEAKTEPEPKPAEPEKPAAPQGPVELKLEAAKPTVKLVSAGKGTKTALKVAPKAGAKQTVEVALDFQGGQDGPPEAGGKQQQIAPTVVLAADVETKEVADGQSKFTLTISGVDAKDVTGAKVPADQFKAELTSLLGATIEGTVGANGATSDLTLKIEKPDPKSMEALALVKTVLLPMWPVLPDQPIAPGAKWTVTTTEKIADQLEVTKTIDYQLVSKKAGQWTIKGTAKVTGKDQELGGENQKAKISDIGGGGSFESVITEGTLVSKSTQKLATDFTISAGDPAKPVLVKFHIEQANALTLK